MTTHQRTNVVIARRAVNGFHRSLISCEARRSNLPHVCQIRYSWMGYIPVSDYLNVELLTLFSQRCPACYLLLALPMKRSAKADLVVPVGAVLTAGAFIKRITSAFYLFGYFVVFAIFVVQLLRGKYSLITNLPPHQLPNSCLRWLKSFFDD